MSTIIFIFNVLGCFIPAGIGIISTWIGFELEKGQQQEKTGSIFKSILNGILVSIGAILIVVSLWLLATVN